MLPLQIHLKPSKRFLALLFLLLTGALVNIAILPLPLSWRLILALLACTYAGHVLWKDGMLLGQKALRTLLAGEGSWHWIEGSQRGYEASLAEDSTIMAGFCLLRFQMARGPSKSCLIFRDAVDAQTYRRLLMILGSINNYEANS